MSKELAPKWNVERDRHANDVVRDTAVAPSFYQSGARI